MLKFSVNETNEQLQVILNGDLDIEGTEVIEEELLPTLSDYKTVNINFENVPFVDSSGIGLLINLVKSLKEQKIKVTISNVSEDVLMIFELVQLDEILGEGVLL